MCILIIFYFILILFNTCENRQVGGTWFNLKNLYTNHRLSSRIIDGSEAVLGEFPHVVSLQMEGRHVCGGNLIDMKTIITAAHCLYKVDDPLHYVAVAGIVSLNDMTSKTRQTSPIGWTLRHKDFIDGFWQSDIAILKLKYSFVETPFVKSVKLPPIGYQPSGFGRVAGWGATKEESQTASDKLMETMLSILPLEKCKYYYGDEIDSSVFCAGPLMGKEDTCQGDSGGPLICGDYLCGIVAAGFGCGNNDEAGIYTKVSHFIEWIYQFSGNEPSFYVEDYEDFHRFATLVNSIFNYKLTFTRI